jgi:hypothetical protein
MFPLEGIEQASVEMVEGLDPFDVINSHRVPGAICPPNRRWQEQATSPHQRAELLGGLFADLL